MRDVQCHIRAYNRYKKSVPTAGVIFYHKDDNSVYFVVVCMRYSKIWSMPKGKQEFKENLITTARREFMEETGIDVDDCLHDTTNYRSINKTRFYLIESDVMNKNFEGYNTKEVERVKWVRITHVMKNQNYYSKQAIAVAKFLQNNNELIL